METVFLSVLNMSATASVVIAAVLLVRALLKKAPKKYSYLLWAVVGFRLCCPVSLSSALSLFNVMPSAPVQSAGPGSTMQYIPDSIALAAQPHADPGTAQLSEAVSRSLPAAAPQVSANPMQIWIALGTVIWCAGMAALLVYSIAGVWKLRRRVAAATRLEGNVWQSEHVSSPFILGVFSPKIYLPYHLSEQERQYVLQHERYHLKRRDYFVKLFAFALLTVHWFNPLCYLAFILMSRDMEMSCDEAVLAGEDGIKAAYSTTLLSFAANRRFPSASPLAFGESGVKSRIKNALAWKAPKVWVAPAAFLLCAAIVFVCAVNPSRTMTAQEALDELKASVEQLGDNVAFRLPKAYRNVENWSIHIAGRREMGENDSMSVHYFEGQEWSAGERYMIGIAGLSELTMEASLPDENSGEMRTISIDLLHPQSGSFSPDAELDTVAELLRAASSEQITDFRTDGTVSEETLVVNSELIAALHSAAEVLKTPAEKEPPDVGDYISAALTLAEERTLIMSVGDKKFSVRFSYLDEVKTAESRELYLLLCALSEARNVELHDLDGDGLCEALCRTSANNKKDLIIYGVRYSRVERIDVNEALLCAASDYAGDIANLPQGFGSMILATHEIGESGYLYHYERGELQYVCTLAEAMSGEGAVEAITAALNAAEIAGAKLNLKEGQKDCGTYDAARAICAQEHLEALRAFQWRGCTPLTPSAAEDTFRISLKSGDVTLTFMQSGEVHLRDTQGDHWVTAGNVGGQYWWMPYGELDAWLREAKSAAEHAGAGTPITAQELSLWRERTASTVTYSGPNGGYYSEASPISCFFTSFYEDVRDLDLGEFLMYCPIAELVEDEEEFALVKKSWKNEDFDYWKDFSLSDMPTPTKRYTLRRINELLTEYAGITFDDLRTDWKAKLDYVPETDSFYNYTSDFGPGVFEPMYGEKSGDMVTLYGRTYSEGTAVLTLRVTGDDFKVVSHINKN